MKGEKVVRKKLIAILLVCCLIAPILFRNPLEAEAATDPYGFNLETPKDFNPNDGENPYGEGKVALNPIMEPFVMRSANSYLHVDYWNDVEPDKSNGISSGDQVRLVNRNSQCAADYVVTKAYDPDGDGHDYMVAAVGLQGQNLVLWNYNSRTKQQGPDKEVATFNGDAFDWFNDIDQWEYTSFFNLTAGDFDGDGKDELAVYVPMRGNPYVSILKPSGNTYQEVSKIEYKDFMSGATISDKFTNDGKTERAMVQASLEAADMDRDGKDELILLGSFANLHDDDDTDTITDRSSSLAIYRDDNKDLQMEQWKTFKLNNSDSTEFDTTPIHIRTASCAAGDIDYDGFPEIVVAGYYVDDEDAMEDDLNGDHFALQTLDYKPAAEAGKLGEVSTGTIRTVKMNAWVDDGFYTSDNIQAPPALTCVAANGRNAKEQVFLEGTMYEFDDSGWTTKATASFCEDSQDWQWGYMISNTYVESAVAGNFDGNEMGIEQVYFTRGYKQTATNHYFYDLCVMGKHGDGQTTAGDYYDNRWSTVHDHKHQKDHLFLTVAAVDADNDTDTIKYKRKEYTYTDANVMAVLQAAPYFEDLKDQYYDGVGETVFGRTTGSGGSTSTTKSASAGAYFNVEIPIFLFIKMDIGATYTHDWEWEYEKEASIEYSIDFAGGQMEDSVVLYRTPMTLYYYDVYPAGGGETSHMTVGVPDSPVYSIMSKEEYNAVAATDENMKDKVITSNVLSSTPGQPSTYNNSAAGLKDFTGYQEFSSASATSTGNISQSITKGSQESSSQSYNNTFELSIGVSGGPVGGGATGGGGWGGGSTTFEYEEVSKTGMVANPPQSEYPYSFQWKFGTWRADLGDTQVPVLGYLVNNVKEPPSLPQNIAVSSVTQDSITLTWDHGARRPVTYEIYQYFEDNVGDNGYSLVATVDGNEKTFTYDGLKPGNSYSLALRSVGADENGEKTMSEYSALVTGTTLQEGSELSVDSITEEVNVCPGDTAVFEVEATPSQGAMNGLSYSWQVQEEDSATWENVQSGNSRLILNNVTEEMDGNRYRCIVSEIQNGERYYVYSKVGVLHVGKADSSVSVATYHDYDNTAKKKTNTGSADYVLAEDGTPTEVNVIKTISVTTQETVGKDGTSQNESVTANYQVFENTLYQAESVYTEAADANQIEQNIYYCENDNAYYALIGLDENAGTADKRVLLTKLEDYFATDEAGTTVISDLRPEDLQGAQEVYTTSTKGADGQETEGERYHTWQVVQYIEDTVEDEEGNKDTVTREEPLFLLYTKISDTGETPTYYRLVNDTMEEWNGTDGNGTEITFGENSGYGLLQVYASEPTKEEINGVSYDVWTDRTDNTAGNEITIYQDADGKYYQKVPDGDKEKMQQIYLITGNLTGTEKGEGETVVTYIANPSEEPVTVTEEYTPVTYTEEDGQTVTLEARVSYNRNEGETAKSVAGQVTFLIVNNRTGEVTTLSGEANEDGVVSVSWTPKTAGYYTITATFGGNDVLHTSSASTEYYATDGPDASVGYVLTKKQAGDVIYGDSFGLELKKAEVEDGMVVLGEPGNNVSVDYSVQYVDLDKVEAEDTTGSGTESGSDADANADALTSEKITGGDAQGVRYTPDKMSGVHTFTATVTEEENVYTASLSLNVLKRPVTMTAPSTEAPLAPGSDDKIPQISQVKVTYTGSENETKNAYAAQADATTYAKENVLQNEVITTPKLTKDSGANNYVTSLAYQTAGEGDNEQNTEVVQQFLNRYDVTLESGLYQIESDIYDVTYAAGANGSLQALKDNNQVAFTSGAGLTGGTEVRFVAHPDDNFKVDTWTVTSDGDPLKAGKDYEQTNDGKKLIFKKLSKDLDVKVTFEPASYELNYSVTDDETGKGNGSTVSAQYLTEEGNGTSIQSGENVLSGSSVRLTAVPEEGYVVDQWTIQRDGEEQPQVQKNEDGSDYAKNTLDIEEMDSDMTVTVSFEEAGEPFAITTSMVSEEGEQLAGGSIEVTGDGYIADETNEAAGTAVKGSAVTFTANLPENMIVREWRISDDERTMYNEGALGYEVVSGSADSYTVHNVQSNLDVQVMATTMQPFKVTYGIDPQTTENGEITSLQGITSGANVDKYYYDTLEFQISPNVGYEIDTVNVTIDNMTVNEASGDESGTDGTTGNESASYRIERMDNSADSKLIVSPGAEGFTGDVDVTIRFKVIEPCVDVTYSLHDLSDGTHGTMTAAADRFGDEDYVVTGTAVGTGSGTGDAGSDLETATLEGVYRDSVITFTATPDEGYRVGKWTVNGVEMTEGVSGDRNTFAYTVKDDAADPTIVKAQMQWVGNKVTFGVVNVLEEEEPGGVVTAVHNGTGDVFHSGTTLGADAEITFTAEAADGYEVVGWRMNGSDVTDGVSADRATYTVTIPADGFTEVQAVFDRIPYTVSWSAEGGIVTAENTTDQVDVTSGDQVRGGRKLTFTAKANDGMKFAGWTVTGATVPEEQLNKNPLTLTVDGDVSLTANFEVKGSYTLNFGRISADGKMGMLTAKVGDDVLTSGAKIPSNSRVTFTAAPAEGYLVEGWYSSADTCTDETRIKGTKYEQNEYVLDGLNDVTNVYVKFEEIPSYDITVVKDGEGSGSLQVLVDGKTVRPEDSGEGAVTADGSGTEGSGVYKVTRHSTVTVKATPENEYSYLKSWNGKDANSTTFTIDDVKENQEITATFAPAVLVDVRFDVPDAYKDTCDPSVRVGSGNDYDAYDSINAIGTEGQILPGKSVLFKVKPPEDMMIDAWTIEYDDANVETVTGRELGLDNSLLVEKVDKSMTVSVTFRDIVAYEIPEEKGYDIDTDGTDDYTITKQMVTPDVLPDTPEYENTVRANGDVSFLVTPADGKWITDIRLAPESDEDEKQESVTIKEELKAKTLSGAKSGEDENFLSYKKNADGSCLVTIQNVTRNLKLIVDTVNYYTVTMESPQHGKLTARDAQGNVIQNGDNVAEGTAITFTAAPEKHYRFDAWGKDAAAYADQSKEIGSVPAGENRGRSVELTMTVEGDLVVSAEFAMTDHINTEIRGAKAATCTADGYTGDTCCKDCGIVLKKGAAIPAQGHQYTSTVTTEPTTRKAGVRTYTCSRCGHSYTEGVEALPKPVMARPIKAGRTKNRISWKKVKGADGYIIMADACNTRSKKAELAVKKVKTILPAGKTSWTHKKLKPATWYKYQIRAFKLVDGKRVVISETPVIHAITSGSSRYANPVKVKVQKAKISVKTGKKKKIKASVILPPNRICQQHTDEIRYVIEDKTIATVNKKGVIRAKSRGKTAVWAVAQNGASKKIMVTVK